VANYFKLVISLISFYIVLSNSNLLKKKVGDSPANWLAASTKLYLDVFTLQNKLKKKQSKPTVWIHISSQWEERKEAGFVYCPIARSSPLKCSGMDHTVVTLQTHHTNLYLVAFIRWRHQCSDSNHLISAYYSFIDPRKMKGWVGLVSWPTADGLPI